jgi:hypothetical protein
MTTGRPSIALKMPSKSPCWSASSLAIAASKLRDDPPAPPRPARARPRPSPWPGWPRGHEDRAADDLQALALAEHVLGAAEADALGAVRAGLLGLLRLVGVRPDAHARILVGPPEDGLEVVLVLVAGLDGRQLARETSPVAVDADPVALADRQARSR